MKAQYYKINLNKASNRLDQFEAVRKKRRILTIGVFFLVVLCGIGFMVYKSLEMEKFIDQQEAELKSIQERIDQLEASSEFLSPEDIFTLANVTRSRLTWSAKMTLLGSTLPKDVAITELTFDDNVNTFVIKGISKVKADMKDLDLVMSIIDLLRQQEEFVDDFSEIKFQSSQRIKHSEQEMVKFEIACLLKS
jgi:Tfp pilus assembly protein PilN